MSNPYYIPRDNSRMQNVLALAGLATQLYGLKQRGDIAAGEQEIGQERNRLTSADIQQRGQIAGATDTRETERNRILEMGAQNERAKTPYYQQNFGYGDDALLKIAASQFGINAKDESNPIIQRSKELADNKNVTKLDAYQAFRGDPEMQQAARESLQKKLETGYAKDPNYLESAEGKKTYQALQSISTEEGWGQAVDMVFKNTVRSVKQEEANSKSAILAEKLAAAEERQKERLAMSDKINQERLTAAEKVNEARLVSAEERNKERIASANELGTLRAQTATEIAQSRLEAAKAIQESKANKGPTPTEIRATAKQVADAETLISTNSSKPEVGGKADFFNQYADKPYAYQWKPGKLYGGDWSKVQLPKIKGKQVTAKDVYDTAAQRGMTYDEVLQAIGALK